VALLTLGVFVCCVSGACSEDGFAACRDGVGRAVTLTPRPATTPKRSYQTAPSPSPPQRGGWLSELSYRRLGKLGGATRGVPGGGWQALEEDDDAALSSAAGMRGALLGFGGGHDAVFDAIDANGDGVVSRAELAAFMKQAGGGSSGSGGVSDEAAARLRDRGALEVHVLRGSQLLAADGGGTSDPYVLVQPYRAPPWHTRVLRGTLEPQWHEAHAFDGLVRAAGRRRATTPPPSHLHHHPAEPHGTPRTPRGTPPLLAGPWRRARQTAGAARA
jgi:hypothetical protein